MQALKLLISAYACEPGKGSEPGVGWRWAMETAALGHEVWVLTRANNQVSIDKALGLHGKLRNLHFRYYDLPAWASFWKRGGRGVHLYYLLWQWGAYKEARRLHKEQQFHAVHHITFGVTRHPSFMGKLGIPFILGPLGGGERAPQELRKFCSLGGRIKDRLRDFANWVARWDPSVRQMYRRAQLILLKTPDSLAWLPQQYHGKAQCMLEIGVDQIPPNTIQPGDLPRRHQALHVLYVGRFLYWKGMDLGLRALAELRARGVQVRLTMIGQGPEKERWQALASSLKLTDCVTWVPWIKQHDLLHAYYTFDVLLFPSLHDSSGNVILEAMACGLPVVALDIGGPGQLVDARCGRLVATTGLSADQTVSRLADALGELARDPQLAEQLRQGALARSQEFAWKKTVGKVWNAQGAGYRAVVHEKNPGEVYASA
ncbi:MAG TPA: glycosyltransferase family 4 protein [Methylophilaceae bacterium]|nr:glycosyltransferase family 4 protein [Methylophilaceae bacterium]